VSWTGSPPTDTARFSRCDAQLADLHNRLGGSIGAPQRRPEPGEQLVDAEGLRYVVVGAGVERRDLLGLVADDREHDHRRAAPRAQLAADRGAAPVRKDEVEHDRVRRVRGDGGQRTLRGLGRLDVVARPAQARSERAEDLRLVVDDKHARAHARTAARRAASGSERTR